MSGAEGSGLSSAEAARRLVTEGPNALPAPRRRSAARRLAEQVVHMFALMLWVAAGLAILAGLPQLGVAIVAVILLNAVFSFLQEARADRAAERLRSLLPARVTVRRDGRRTDVEAADVVRGDLLLLGAGDRIPADAVVLLAHGLRLDTSLLTGESEPSAAGVRDAVFAGTFVVEGEGDAEVVATGAGTRLAEIARLTTASPKPVTPLTRALRRVVRTISVIAVGVGAAFFAVALVLGTPPADGFVFAIGVTVALVPEALLPTVTLSLAWGAEQMARRSVLVRELEAVETLGSTTFICTDKTGTLTRNEMTVVEAWTPAGCARSAAAGYDPAGAVEVADDGVVADGGVVTDGAARAALARLAWAGARCSAGYAVEVDGTWRAHGDPMEAAIDVFARRLGVTTAAGRAHGDGAVRFPFDPRRRRMSLVAGEEVLVKGAPDAILPLCVGVAGGEGVAGAEDLAVGENADGGPGPALGEARAVVDRLTARGLRLLAVAAREVGPNAPATADEAERDLTLLGVLALEDPPRPDVHEALDACRRARITVAMVTGDHPATAAAIATEVGLRGPDDPVLVGADLPEDEEALGEMLDRPGVVVARVSPEQKVRIARALRARGHVVAMTGDGVNDGPALHEANIGVAMGASGTDVAREAADLVLLDDHFASIVAGIEQGRATYVNMRRFLTYHLTDNVAELTPFVVWVLSGGTFPLALGVLQILALDIGTDTLSATALGAEPPAKHLLEGPPVRGRLMNGTVLRRAFGLLGPTVAAATMLAFVASLWVAGWRPGGAVPAGDALAAASGAAFMTVVIAQTANAFACRSSTKWPGQLGWTTNRLLIPAASVEVVFALGALWIPPVAEALGQANPPPVGWAVAFASAALVLGVDRLDKSIRARRPRPPHETGELDREHPAGSRTSRRKANSGSSRNDGMFAESAHRRGGQGRRLVT